MSEATLKTLSDNISEAHPRIQQKHSQLNPVVEVRRGMRDSGIPADVLSIDCLSSRRRILFVVHDANPGIVLTQFLTMDDEMGMEFSQVPINTLSTDVLCVWIEDYFLKGETPAS